MSDTVRSTDQQLRDLVYVSDSAIHGMGLFAARDIDRDEYIGTFFGPEADGDGALSMEILKVISGGSATLFADVSHMDAEKKILYLPNCGGMCSWFAGRADDATENLQHIELRPSVRPGGGAIALMISPSIW